MHKLKLKSKWRKSSTYKKSLIIFGTILLTLSVVFLIYVYNSMVIYERNLVDNYIKYLTESGKLTKDIKDDLFTVSKYEKKGAKISDGVKKLYNSDDLKIKRNSKESKDGLVAYDLYNGDTLLSTVSLKNTNSYTRMAILKIDEWEIVNSKTYFEDGIYSYEITVPKNYKVYVNNNLLDSDIITDEKDVSGLEKLTEYVEISPSVVYKVNDLVYKPDIKILDEDGNNVDYTIKNKQKTVTKDFKNIALEEEAKKYLKEDFNVLSLAENWSLYLTDDLKGANHGFNYFTPYLIKDSYMYKMAYDWAHNVDISFVSSHSLKNPVFTNEEVKNYIIYNDNAFSAEVYLEKNMVVSGQTKIDIMHDRLYFIYYNNSYKLVGMEAIKE